jgi:hypothetical protein
LLGFPLLFFFSFFFLLCGFRIISLNRPVLSYEISFLPAIKIFSFLFLGYPSFLCFFSEGPFLFSKSPISFLIYLVEMSFGFFLLEVNILIIPFIFLGPFFKIVVEARRRRDQIYLSEWEFLYGYNVFDFLRKALVKLCHFSPFVPGHFESILGEFGQIL